MKKLIVSIMIVVMLSTVFTSCAKKDDTSGGTETTKVETKKGGEETASGKEETKEPEREHVTISWYLRHSEPANKDAVLAKANEIFKEKLNVTLDMNFVEPGEWKEKLPLMYAAGEEFDILWTGYWGGFGYSGGVAKGAFIELDELLAEKAPNLLEDYPQSLWDGIKLNDKIYAVPNYQITYQQRGFRVRKDLTEKYNIDINDLKTKEGMLDVFKTIKENENIYPLTTGLNIAYYMLQKEYNAKGIYQGPNEWFVDTNTWKVLEGTDQDPKLEFYEFTRELYEKGYISPDAITLKDRTKEFNTGKYYMLEVNYKPGSSEELSSKHGFEVISFPTGNPITSINSSTATLTAISTMSKHPERAMEVINLVNTDKELFNMLVYGLEGQDYNKIEENRVELIDGGYSLHAWKLGNQFNAYLIPGFPDDVWEQTIKTNEEAEVSPLNGFAFDKSNIQIEEANVRSVDDEFNPIFQSGAMPMDEYYELYNEKAKQAGKDVVIAEYQRQLDEWVAKNK